MTDIRPRMSAEEYELYKLLKENPAIAEQLSGLQKEAVSQGIPIQDIQHYWYKSKHYSIFAKSAGKTYEEVKDEIIKQMKVYAPEYPTFTYEKGEHLLVIDPSDIHIGKLSVAAETGEDYNIDKAVKRTVEGVDGILHKSKGFDIDRILFIVGNDALHIDTPRRTSTAGTPQDTDGMWHEAFLAAKDMYVQCIEVLMRVAPVHIMYCPSNHDYTSGYFLADTLKSWFRRAQSVSFDTSINHRKYYRYGLNMIEADHGDGCKPDQTPLLMADEQPDMWAKTKFRYSYKHHMHHRISKDLVGVNLTTLRSPSPADGWHHRNGFVNKPAVEGFVHHKDQGRIAQLTHYFV